MKKFISSIFFRIIIFIFAVIFFLVIGEVIVRKKSPQMTFSDANKFSVDCFSASNILPISLSANHTCRMRGYIPESYDVTAKINKNGYRGKEFALDKPTGTYRILILGDSQTFGHGVDDAHTYPFLTEEILREYKYKNAEVINAGYISGYSPDSYYLYLKTQGVKLAPDLVVVGLFVLNEISDLSETVWTKTDTEGLPEKIDSCCNVVDGKIRRRASIEFKYRYPILRESHLYLLLIDILQKRIHLQTSRETMKPKSEQRLHCTLDSECIHHFYPEEVKTHMVINAMKKIATEQNFKLLFVLLPADIQFSIQAAIKYGDTYMPPKDNPNFLQKRLIEFFSQNNIEYLDLYPMFKERQDKGEVLFLYYDPHYNNQGNHLVASEIAKFIKDKGYINNN
jgi:hypothetical protein